MSESLRTSELAAAAGVNAQTLRYYERTGLLREPNRSLGGHRLYPVDAVTRIRVIKAAQGLGFTLREVAELIDVAGHHHRPADRGLRDHAQQKLVEVEEKIADLQVIASTLRAAIAAGCEDLAECAASDQCPIPFADLHRPAGANRVSSRPRPRSSGRGTRA